MFNSLLPKKPNPGLLSKNVIGHLSGQLSQQSANIHSTLLLHMCKSAWFMLHCTCNNILELCSIPSTNTTCARIYYLLLGYITAWLLILKLRPDADLTQCWMTNKNTVMILRWILFVWQFLAQKQLKKRNKVLRIKKWEIEIKKQPLTNIHSSHFLLSLTLAQTFTACCPPSTTVPIAK